MMKTHFLLFVIILRLRDLSYKESLLLVFKIKINDVNNKKNE